MQQPPESAAVSVVIPTYNRRETVVHAIDSVLAQTRPVKEIIVVDDGSSDGTRETLAQRYGSRIHYHYQANGGVSSARNAGMRLATGEFIGLLDSDDSWDPHKCEVQSGWLQAHPDFGAVLCDVTLTDVEGKVLDVYRRRASLPEDGWILKWVLLQPALIPSSMMIRREVVERLGGFDENLVTAEDLDLHLRLAMQWKIGLVSRPLVSCIRGHDGLSSLTRTDDDYVQVIERATERARGMVDEDLLQRARFLAYERNVKGMIYSYRWRDALGLYRNAWAHAGSLNSKFRLLRLCGLAARRWAHGLRTGHG